MALNLENQLRFVSRLGDKPLKSGAFADLCQVWRISSRHCMQLSDLEKSILLILAQTNIAIHTIGVPAILWTTFVLVRIH